MKNWQDFITELVVQMGFKDYRVDIDAEHNHGVLYLHDDPNLIKENLSSIVESLNYLIQLIAHKENLHPLFLDVNNYRKEREQLIIELAKATARKAIATGQEVALPAMNSYERRIAHMELSTRPDVTTESIGKGKGRYVVVRPIVDGTTRPASQDRENVATPAGSEAGDSTAKPKPSSLDNIDTDIEIPPLDDHFKD